jgi:ankyrin repeat protein/energy-coupling factor transporter ATP-binding protein EcfA2
MYNATKLTFFFPFQDDHRCQNSGDPVLEKGHLDDIVERDFNTYLEAINARDSLQDRQQGADFEKTNVIWNTLLTDGSGNEETGPKNNEPDATVAEAFGSDVIIRRVSDINSLLSEERHFPQEYAEKRKGISLEEGLTLVLEDTVVKHDTYSCGTDAKNDGRSLKNDNSDIISKIINFQGKDVTVASLIGELILPETQVLLDELKTTLSTESKPVIGRACDHIEGPYIPRTLERNTFLRSDVLNQKTSKLPPVFAISGMTEQELKETLLPYEKISHFVGGSRIENSGPKIVLLNDITAAHEFLHLCNRARNFKSIHWLAKHPDGFEWRGSKGNMDVVKQYIDFSKRKHIPSITDLRGETVIISGKRGEGKSTYLTHLQSVMKENLPDTWVIRLNLNDHPSLKEKCDVTESLVIDLLSSAAGFDTSPYASIGKALLTHGLQITGKVIVLIDDIDMRHGDKIHVLLRILNNMKTINVVIAADPRISTTIENSLSTLACSLKPLSKGELQLLMMQLWTTDLPQDDDNDKDDDTLRDEFSAELLHVIGKNSISGNSPSPFCITMASHIFQKEYMSSLSTKVTNLPKTLDSIELYERYIQWEFEMYKNNKGGSAEVLESYLAQVTRCSMSSFFSEDIVEKILPLEVSTREITDKVPPLPPRLQQYVTAKWFAKNFQNHRSFIEETYFEAELQTMWEIFERILAKHSELHMCVLDGDIQRVSDLLASGLDVNCSDKGGRTALHVAALKGKYADQQVDDGCVQIVSLLMDHGADILIVDDVLKWTALRYADMTASWTTVDRLLQDVAADISDMSYTKHKLHDPNFLQEILTEAAVNGFTYVTAFILDTGVDINISLRSTRYSHQQYALVHIASENGHISLLEFLLEKGADANTYIWDNSTPLHLACRQGNKECVVALLRISASTDRSNKKGDTPLHEAVRSRNSEIVQILLSNNAEAEVCNKDGDTPLHVACQMNNLTAVSHLMDRNTFMGNRNKNGDSPLDCAIRRGHTTLVKYILKAANSSVKERNTNGHTPVHLAAGIGDVLMLDYLLQVMPEVNVYTDGRDTPLHIASLNGHTDAVAFLLKKGADSNRTNKHGNTALHLASVRGHINVMKTLMESNAQVNVTNKEGNTPLHLVCLQGQASAARCLLQHNADADVKNREKNTPMHLAAIKGEVGVITSLIETNCDVNIPDKHGDTILHQCARNGKLEIVGILVKTGRCDLDAKNSTGETPLITATKSGFADVVECLVHGGADVNFPTEDGDTPIQLAVRKGDVELVTRLFRLGADINVPNSRGNTALHTAVYGDNRLLVQQLVKHGADRTIRNSSGYTPFDLAVRLNSIEAIRHAL